MTTASSSPANRAAASRTCRFPGGRPKRGEFVLDALAREVLEETGVHIRAGRLLYVARCVNSYRLHDLNLVFAAAAIDPLDERTVLLADPADAGGVPVVPPILDAIAGERRGRPPHGCSAMSGSPPWRRP